MTEKYILTRRRGMKNLRLRVASDGGVHVSAPYGVSAERIDEFVKSRGDWIKRQREALPQEDGELRDGGSLTLFGRKLAVRVVRGENACREEDGVLTIFCEDTGNAAKLEELALSFMAERCRAVLEDAFRRYINASGYSGAPPTLRLSLMKSRWGSCDRGKNEITLNLMLCKLPERFSYYVAAHETAHLFVPNHSEAFYRMGEKLYPGFRETDRELNRVRVGSILS